MQHIEIITAQRRRIAQLGSSITANGMHLVSSQCLVAKIIPIGGWPDAAEPFDFRLASLAHAQIG